MKNGLLFLLLLLFNSLLFGQNAGDYRSVATGLWSSTSTWERWNGSAWATPVTAPSSADGVITIRAPHTVTSNAAVTADQIVINLGGALSITFAFILANGTGTDLTCRGTLDISARVINNGTINVPSGELTINPSDTLTSNGTLNITGGGMTNNGTVTNNGTINITAGNLTINPSGTLTTSGTLNVFTIDLTGLINDGSVTNNGTINITNGAGLIISSSGTLTNNATLQVSTGAQLMINSSGTLTNNATLQVSTGAELVINSSGTLTNKGPININTTGILTNNAMVNFEGGSFNFFDGTLDNNGVFNNSFDGTLNNNSGTNVLTNSGTFSKTAGSGTTSVNIPFINTSTGIFGGKTGSLNFTNLTNNGSITPGLEMSPGSFTLVTTSSIFTTNSTLSIEMLNDEGPGTGHDQLIVGDAALNGTLTVTELFGASVPGGMSYTIIASTGTLSGTFNSVSLPSSRYSIMYNPASVVLFKNLLAPLTLISFTAYNKAESVELNWKTSSETNTDRFSIERSSNGFAFSPIGSIAASGNSTAVKSYDFADQQPLNPVNYYRLKMIDQDDKFEYSKTIKVNRNQLESITASPNPVHNQLKVAGLNEGHLYEIQLVNFNGQIVSKTKTSSAEVNINLTDQTSGIYILKVIAADKTTITYKEIIKQ